MIHHVFIIDAHKEIVVFYQDPVLETPSIDIKELQDFYQQVKKAQDFVIDIKHPIRYIGKPLGRGVVVFATDDQDEVEQLAVKLDEVTNEFRKVISHEVGIEKFEKQLLSLLGIPLQEGDIAIHEELLFLGKLNIQLTPAGYAVLTVNRPLDIMFVKQFFHTEDVYVEADQASIIVKQNANIFLYAEPHDIQRISFGPIMDYELLILVLKYVNEVMRRNV